MSKNTAKKQQKAEEQRLKAQQERRRQERREMMKRIGVIAVCVVLVLAFCVPTVAISLLGSWA